MLWSSALDYPLQACVIGYIADILKAKGVRLLS